MTIASALASTSRLSWDETWQSADGADRTLELHAKRDTAIDRLDDVVRAIADLEQ